MRVAFLIFSCLLIAHLAGAQDCVLVLTNGGGITGAAIVYKIGMDGKVLKGKGLGAITFNEQSKIKKSVARKYYTKAKAALGTASDFNHPGNMYYALATQENGQETKVTWGDAQYTAPEPASNLYQEISKVLNTLTFTANSKK